MFYQMVKFIEDHMDGNLTIRFNKEEYESICLKNNIPAYLDYDG